SEPATPAAHGTPLQVHPAPLSLGVLKPGQAAQASLTLRNPCPEPLTVERIETSCPCIRVAPQQPVRIEPGRAAVLGVSFDPSGEPDFRGGLSVDVTGYGASEAVLFRNRVLLTVEAGSAKQPPGRIAYQPAAAGGALP
ncbi:MAG: DUF1573 domain-containing protein, partial [Isosphaeraceae bacterium]|nr:DUF1573 domain-containing protein [Isosphaeraceae bacterium]